MKKIINDATESLDIFMSSRRVIFSHFYYSLLRRDLMKEIKTKNLNDET